MKNYKCLFNHELLILVTSETPYQSYRENVKADTARAYIAELKDTDVDVIMCCPTAWKTPLYPSKVDPKWQDAAGQVEPLPEEEWKYYDKVYWRARRMMLSGLDPVKISVETAHDCGKDIFMSYRMNEHHLNIVPSAPTHSRFWKENPQFYIQPELIGKTGDNAPLCLNYLHQAVRDYFKDVVCELMDNYDFDGLELDFMRGAAYFPSEKIKEGTAVMTAFVGEIRRRLDEVEKARGRKLPLCVRVPRTLKNCAEIGLDLVAWNRDGLIDMVNVSTSFVTALNCGLEDFKKTLPGCRIFGELHFVYEFGGLIPGWYKESMRLTPDEVYRTAALTYFDRGADGVSFFNFDYVREHSFFDPRRKRFPGKEPHFDVLKGITNAQELRARSKFYHWGHTYSPFSVTLDSNASAEIDVYIAETDSALASFSSVWRMEGRQNIEVIPFRLFVNEREAAPQPLMTGELFTPFSTEGLPPGENLQYFSELASSLKHGWNKIRLTNSSNKEYSWSAATIKCIQVALYAEGHR